MSANFFLSYSKKDIAVAHEIIAIIEKAGGTAWWDQLIEQGVAFRGEIDAKLQDADFVVVLWTTNSAKSNWVISEAVQARDTGRLISLCVTGSTVPLGFRQHQFFEVSENIGSQQLEADRLRRIFANSDVRASGRPVERRGFITIDFAARYRLSLLSTVWKALVFYLITYLAHGLANGFDGWRSETGAFLLPSKISWVAVLGFASLLIGRLMLPDKLGIYRNRPERFVEPRATWWWSACFFVTLLFQAVSVWKKFDDVTEIAGGVNLVLEVLGDSAYLANGLFALPCFVLHLLSNFGALNNRERIRPAAQPQA